MSHYFVQSFEIMYRKCVHVRKKEGKNEATDVSGGRFLTDFLKSICYAYQPTYIINNLNTPIGYY